MGQASAGRRRFLCVSVVASLIAVAALFETSTAIVLGALWILWLGVAMYPLRRQALLHDAADVAALEAQQIELKTKAAEAKMKLAEFAESVVREVQALLRAGKLPDAVKVLRDYTGAAGLPEAVAVVKSWQGRLDPSESPPVPRFRTKVLRCAVGALCGALGGVLIALLALARLWASGAFFTWQTALIRVLLVATGLALFSALSIALTTWQPLRKIGRLYGARVLLGASKRARFGIPVTLGSGHGSVAGLHCRQPPSGNRGL
jgi:hypothetical protein